MRMFVGAICLVCIWSISSAQTSWTEAVRQTVGGWLFSKHPDTQFSTAETAVTVDVLWGVPDKEATVGEVFKMPIPNNAFSGDVQNYTSTSNPYKTVTLSTSPYPSEPVEASPTAVPSLGRSSSVESEGSYRAPQLVNPMQRIVIYLGTYFDVLVPFDTFYDYEDGNTRSLKLSLQTSSGLPLPPDSFIQLDSMSQTLYGLPLEQDVMNGTHIVQLVAENNYGGRATDNIEVIINTASVQDVSFVIESVFSLDYQMFSMKRDNLMVLMQRIASFYGDQSAKFYTVTSVRNGSVLVEWTDNRVSKLTCESSIISSIYGKLSSEGAVRPDFRQKLLPEFPLTRLSYQLLGVCSEPATTAVVSTEFVAVAAAGGNTALAIVLPIIIIIMLIIVVFLVYWFCIRNRHKHSDYLTDHEKQVYANNRKPVLLESDLEMNDVPLKPRRPLVLEQDVPSRAFDNPGYLDLDDSGRPPPPPYTLPVDSPFSPDYGPIQATSTPKLYMPYNGDTPNNRAPPPPPYRLPPLYLGTPGSSDI